MKHAPAAALTASAVTNTPLVRRSFAATESRDTTAGPLSFAGLHSLASFRTDGALRPADRSEGDGGAGAGGADVGGSVPQPDVDVPPPRLPAPLAGGGVSPPVRVLRVEVVPPSRGHFPQIAGTGAGTHWVGVASTTAPKPIVRAVVSPSVAPTDPAVAGLVWSGPGVTPDPSNPLQAEVDRTAARRRVRATLGTSSASTTLWSVFATISATNGPAPTFSSDAAGARPGGNADFSATIFPGTILTDPDRPDLDGANDTDPPGGNHWTGAPLSDGADHHWDFSRKMRTKVINPAGIADAAWARPGGLVPTFLANRPAAYPTPWEEGNDDRSTGDETNEPATSAMTSTDDPGFTFIHAAGADGDTFEVRMHFLEFVRLELDHAWWVPSHMSPWRVHLRIRRDAGRWVDDGTDAAADNSGF